MRAKLAVPKHQHHLSVRSTSTDVCTTFDEDVKGVSSHAVEEKIGVLLLNLGGPETLTDVQPFLFILFAYPVSDHTTCYSFNFQCNFTCSLLIMCNQ